MQDYGIIIDDNAPLEIVNCQQEHCRGIGKDEQFYCTKHDVELCSVCRYAHEACEHEGLLCRGNRQQNGGPLSVGPQTVVETKQESWKDLVNERTMKRVNELFGEMTEEQLKSMSYEHFPSELKMVFTEEKEFQEKERLRNAKIKPVKFTKSTDGKTCWYCNADLVESNDGTFLKCPTEFSTCRTWENETKINLVENAKRLVEIENKSEYKIEHLTLDMAKKVVAANNDRLVTVNANFSLMTLENMTTESYEPVKGEGKIVSYEMCKEEFENTRSEIPDNYKLVKVESLGKAFGHRHECRFHRIPYSYEFEEMSDEDRRNMKDENDLKIQYVKVSIQRLTSVFDKKLLEFFDKQRKWIGSSKGWKVAEVPHFGYNDRCSNFIVARCKALSKREEIEVIVREWMFSDYRYDRKHGSNVFVGDQTHTLNHYRGRDDFAIFMTRDVFKDWEEKKFESRNPWIIPPSPTFSGIPKEQEQKDAERKAYVAIFEKVAKQLGVEHNEILVGPFDGQVTLACKIKKGRRN